MWPALLGALSVGLTSTPAIKPFSPFQLGRFYRFTPETDGSPLLRVASFDCMLAVPTAGAPSTARAIAASGSALPFGKQGRLLRSRSISGRFFRSLIPAYNLLLRFATAVTLKEFAEHAKGKASSQPVCWSKRVRETAPIGHRRERIGLKCTSPAIVILGRSAAEIC
jgi:hypothetical protein